MVSDETIEGVAEQAQLTASYLVLMGLAGVLAAVALLTNSVPVLIGAMIVAPALPPVALVAFALVGGKVRQALSGFVTAVAGLLVATAFAMLTTWVMNVTNVLPPEANLLEKPLLEERVHPGWYSVAAALAAGIAGTMALAARKQDTLIGVVAALALVPAAAAGGIAFLSHDPMRGLGGFWLLAMNVVVIILAGAATLMVMRPGRRDRTPQPAGTEGGPQAEH